jgi:hypothetical protein
MFGYILLASTFMHSVCSASEEGRGQCLKLSCSETVKVVKNKTIVRQGLRTAKSIHHGKMQPLATGVIFAPSWAVKNHPQHSLDAQC